MEKVEYKGRNLYKWKIGASSFLVDIERGTRVLSWDISIAGNVRNIIYKDLDSLLAGSAVLFPFAGTCSIKGESSKWKTPQGDTLNMPENGFAKDAEFKIESIDDTGFCAKLCQSPEFTALYPYDYELYVIYEFTMFSFSVELRLENKGVEDMPSCVGNKFYFNVPWHENRTKSDYLCQIQAKSAFLYGGAKLEKLDALKTFELSEERQNNVLHTNLRSAEASICSKNGEENINVKIISQDILDKNTCFETSTKKGENFYSLNPWAGLANAAEHKKGLRILKGGETQSFKVEVSL